MSRKIIHKCKGDTWSLRDLRGRRIQSASFTDDHLILVLSSKVTLKVHLFASPDRVQLLVPEIKEVPVVHNINPNGQSLGPEPMKLPSKPRPTL